MMAAWKTGQLEDAKEHAENLRGWISRGGFVPPKYRPSEFLLNLRHIERITAQIVLS